MDDMERDQQLEAERRRIVSAVLHVEDFQPLSALVTVDFGACSRAGLERSQNEDHYMILRLRRDQEILATSLLPFDLPGRFEERGYAMVVADGGGMAGSGAQASRLAISTIAHLAVHSAKWNLRIDAHTAESIVERAEWFYEGAARAVDRQGLSTQALAGMSTTLTATFSAGDQLFYAHVGNSRAYLFREGELIQLTRDHTLGQRLAEVSRPVAVPRVPQHELENILTDAIGAGRGLPMVDVERFRLLDNDIILLCTDGLTASLDEDTIAEVLSHPRRLPDQCKLLIELASRRACRDDATALLARYRIPAVSQVSAGPLVR
jgi:protein phosphatase